MSLQLQAWEGMHTAWWAPVYQVGKSNIQSAESQPSEQPQKVSTIQLD